MYFVKFTKRRVYSHKPTNKTMTYKEFDNKTEALRWLSENGYEPDLVPAGGNPFNSNMFWNDEHKTSAMGLSY